MDHVAPLWAYAVAFLVTEVGLMVTVRALVVRATDANALRVEQERVAQSRERFARIGTLSAGVAHNVRSPLHGLSQGVAVLESSCSACSPDKGDLLQEMRRAVDHLERVTRRLLRPDRARTGGAVVDVGDAVDDAVRLVASRAQGAGVHVSAETEHGLRVRADSSDLDEALVNLIDNAIDASAHGGPVVVRVATVDDHRVIVEICDRGTGMAEDVIERIFDPFFTTKPMGRGTGLGLPIARRTIEDLGGSLEVESSVGCGTCVRLSLPRVGPRSLRQAPASAG